MASGGRRENAGRKPKAIPSGISPGAIRKMLENPEPVHFPIRFYEPPRGVVPQGETAQVANDAGLQLAMDTSPGFGDQFYAYSNIAGFPGYPYLMALSLRTEYRQMATALSTERTRKWITINSTDTDDEGTKDKITQIEQAFSRLHCQQVVRKQVEHDAFYGTGQILINHRGADLETPLILSEKTIKKGMLQGFTNVDPVWTTPLSYNALDPSSPDFYKPSAWWVMGQRWDATRMIIMVTREVPDIFKPGFNFSGISLSQLAEPYVNNWLRTRQSVSDLVNNFSILVLKTAMDQVLTGGSDGSDLFSRIKLFSACRSNKGVMALDKDREELEQLAVPLSGLHELQAQAQEQMCCPSHEPATIMTGISPSGFGNVSEGEIRMWNDWVHALQEAYDRPVIETMLKLVQLDLFGEIDPEITIQFNPLYEMTEEQISNMRVNESIRAGNLIDRGVIDSTEERERLARDPDSGYQGIDIDKEIEQPAEEELGASLGKGTA